MPLKINELLGNTDIEKMRNLRDRMSQIYENTYHDVYGWTGELYQLSESAKDYLTKQDPRHGKHSGPAGSGRSRG